jgi:Zn-dependent oligopeptidase
MAKSKVVEFLNQLNNTYAKLHKDYEELFWISYMGDHSVDDKMTRALKARDAFRSDPKYLVEIKALEQEATKEEKIRLGYWKMFFSKFQIPKEVLAIKNQIDELEQKVNKKTSSLKEGYIDPYTRKFVKTSRLKMRSLMRISDDEKIRKACFDAIEKLSVVSVPEYIQLVKLRNKFAQALGFEDFYAYKVMSEEGLTKTELFKLFDEIYNKTKYAFADIRKLEKEKMPGLRKPWNYSYMLAGDFTKEEDPYYQFDEAVLAWGRSFTALGIDFQGGTLQLDLLDRPGKYPNGFCHWPQIIQFKNGKRIPGATNFTANTVYGQVGAGSVGAHTLFHEGGHAADRLNSEMVDVCLNTEYPPASTAWAETQSMFIDTMWSSIEWRTRYAKNSSGQMYPFDLFERKVRKLNLLSPLAMMGIYDVMVFEKKIYETKNLNRKKVIEIAKWAHRKCTDWSEDSVFLLYVPHIYSFESACSYHGYGLAELSLMQWREYFYKKYGYIVDNPNVGKEMKKVWALASSKTYKEFVKFATGKPISSKAFIDEATQKADQVIGRAKTRLKRMEKVPEFTGKVYLKAMVRLVHGKKVIADNSKGFEKMTEKYKLWLHKTYPPAK